MQPGELTFRITDTSRLVAELEVPQTELARFRAGQPLALRVDAAPGAVFNAEIARISPTIDRETGTFGITAYIDNRDGALVPGMFARVSIRTEKHAQVVTIPVTAVVDEDGRQVVYIIADGTAERRPVRTGIADGGRVEIVAGLAVGETVIASGAGGLRDGTRVVATTAANSTSGD
ncbi:MAG: efflux RND transporter periplasmic adaptor subunit [Woeseiaceae bacterium]|nr:efflux RND transporter periplasmic adaptor subunit [Woeseiaceae bacterium]